MKDLSKPSKPLAPKQGQNQLSIVLWVATIVYVGLLLLSPPGWLPGEPLWAIKTETIREILDESLNFFFILPFLNFLGFSYLQAPTVAPTTQGFFNVAEAWIFMFLPLMMMDGRSRHLPKMMFWGLAMFLTNVFLMPYMALRLRSPINKPPNNIGSNINKGALARIFGTLGLTVGTSAVMWFCFNQPELGGLLSRFGELGQQIIHNRVTLAFAIDVILFWLFQSWLMGAIIPPGERLRALRFIPFWGLALWLLI